MEPVKGTNLPYFFSFLFVLLASTCSYGQLIADFNLDKSGGCSPLTVKFTNNSSGASANAVWSWDFGNGNVSSAKNPSANFIDETTYSITLTVRDGALTSTKTKTVSVYKKPVFDFKTDPAKGCLPLQTTFTATPSGGDGSVNRWFWDFGDGITEESAGNEISHLYRFKQSASVSLTAISNYGCSRTIIKEQLVQVEDSIRVAFTADKRVLCETGGSITFTNTSTGAGTLSYFWDFGDGSSSASKSPAHVYPKRGTYTVKLTVKSSEGCEVTRTETNYINVRDYDSDFLVPALTCEDNQLVFQNTSVPTPSKTTWYVDGIETYPYSDFSLYTSIANPGQHSVKMVNQFKGCEQSVTKQVDIKRNPQIKPFVVESPFVCDAPIEVKFRDTSADAVKWRWDFTYYWGSAETESVVKNPTYSYQYPGDFYVFLEIENAAGCKSSQVKTISLQRPNVYFITTDLSGDTKCDSLTKQFEAVTSDPISTYLWDFGDGTKSTAANPVHVYKTPGTFYPQLTYKTVHGCTGTTNFGYRITVLTRPKSDFSVQSAACGNNIVYFTPRITGSADWYFWEWGDGSRSYWNDYVNGHHYQDSGTYTVSLVTYNGYCNDTITKERIITVKGPFPKIEKIDYSCDGLRNTIVITDGTKLAKKWIWNFGDGLTETYTSFRPAISHTYKKSGRYQVTLITENDNCVLRDSVIVDIVMKQNLRLNFREDSVCLGNPGYLFVKGSDPNVVRPDYLGTYLDYRAEYKGGTAFDGTFYHSAIGNYPDFESAIHPFSAMRDSVRLIVTTYLNGSYCQDTTSYDLLIARGPTARFKVAAESKCFNSTVIFEDNSTASPGFEIASRTWNFGDGESIVVSKGGKISHKYKSPGYYYVSLMVTDNAGCNTAYLGNTEVIMVGGAKASFYASPGTEVGKGTDVQFTNNSITYYAMGEVSYEWNFGDGTVSTAESPSHQYNKTGVYPVRLIAKDKVTGCLDTFSLSITVSDIQHGASFYSTVSFIGDNNACPPVNASYRLETNLNYTRLFWNFGDGFTLENQPNASHVYTKPGIYPVRLEIYENSVLIKTYRDTVKVIAPQVLLAAPDNSVCIGEPVKLISPTKKNGYNYSWDFGGGAVLTGTDTVSTHSYQQSGSYFPTLIVSDALGCSNSVKLADKITVHPNPAITISPANAIVCKGTSVQLKATGALQYQWSPAAGLSNSTIADPMAAPLTNTTYLVRGKDLNGCSGSSEISVTVPQPFTIQSPVSLDVCEGKQVQLSASGAQTYQWINQVAGLSNINIADPVASPNSTTTYTVVGFDQYRCYSDTNEIVVNLRPSPSISLGADHQVNVGEEIVLKSTGTNDIVKWEWTPATYLSCSNCASPVAAPLSTTEYQLNVYTKYNCIASDQLKITAVCSGDIIFIPNAFTPNGDGLNDLFRIPKKGVGKVNYFRIFNSWGQVVFEKKNYFPGDPAGNWDGRFKGLDVPAGAYVYQAEMECFAGMKIERKGTVTVIR